MSARRFKSLLLGVLLIPGAYAEEHFVTVRDDIYDPEVVEIEDGDTVTWRTGEDNQNPHNVRADDDSFNSGAPQLNFEFSHTFNTGDAEIFYYDTGFGGPGGQGMSGAVVVGEGVPEPFAITYGITGSWFDPDTDGQGFSIEIVPSQNVLVVYWFAYKAEETAKGTIATQMWLQGSGEIVGDSATVPLQRPVNGLFDSSQPPQFPQWGSATFTFSSCENGTVDYESDVDNVSGTIEIVRITPDVQCAAGAKRLLKTGG